MSVLVFAHTADQRYLLPVHIVWCWGAPPFAASAALVVHVGATAVITVIGVAPFKLQFVRISRRALLSSFFLPGQKKKRPKFVKTAFAVPHATCTWGTQVVHAVSHLPAGSSAQSATAAVRALGPRYAGVAAVDSGIVDVLTRLEKPGGAEEAEEEGTGTDRRREEELAHEQLLFGMEVRQGKEGGGGELTVVSGGAPVSGGGLGCIELVWLVLLPWPPARVWPHGCC